MFLMNRERKLIQENVVLKFKHMKNGKMIFYI